MHIENYTLDEIRFSYCYRVYFRWQTHRAASQPELLNLRAQSLQEIVAKYQINILETGPSRSGISVLASLRPTESVSVCASKLKGQVSKWIRDRVGPGAAPSLLAKGYFAKTTGGTTTSSLSQYLENQGEHHGYMDRVRPPIVVRQWEITPEDEAQLQASHSSTILRHHIVLATPGRRGLFNRKSGSSVAECWRDVCTSQRVALMKVSFLPDHVHAAVRVHPKVVPGELVVLLMDAAQGLMYREFDRDVIRTGNDRIWQASAYIGSFGDLESAKVARYIQRLSQDGKVA